MKKKEFNEKLSKMSIKELFDTYKSKHNELMTLQTKMRGKNGSSVLIRNYPAKKEGNNKFGNVRQLKRDIARIKTFMHVKMVNNG